MSQLKVNTIRHTGASSDSVTLASDGTATAKLTNNLSHRNLVINGSMAVNQRGTLTGISISKMGGPDRFRTHIVNLGTWTTSQESSATDLNTTGFQHSLKMQNTTADASPAAGGYAVLIYRLEGYDAAPLRYGTASAKQSTLSFWCKANISGWSSGTKSFVAELQAAGGSSESGQLVTLTNNDTWQKVELTYPANTSTALNTTNGEALAINLWLDSGSTYTSGTVASAWSNKANGDRAGGLTLGLGNNTANYFQITGVQFEVSDYATEFEHKKYQDELYNCQRYYQQVGTTTQDGQFCIGASHLTSAGDQTRVGYFGQNNLRATPTITEFGDGLRVIGSGSNTPVTSIGDINVTSGSAYLQFNAECTDIGDDNEIVVVTNTANGGIKIEAEL